jgi:hypothetical protein
MAPTRRHPIHDDDRQRWAELRDEARQGFEALMAQGPTETDALGRLAWKAGTLLDGGTGLDEELRLAIENARARGATWRQIAVAMGEPDDDGTAKRVQARQQWRNKHHDETVG